MIRNLLIGGVLVTAAIGLAAPANADQYDYVSALDNSGVSYPNGSISQAIDLGKAVCHDIRIGTPVGIVANKLVGVGYSGWEAGTIIGAAANGMCPDTWPTLRAYLQSSTGGGTATGAGGSIA